MTPLDDIQAAIAMSHTIMFTLQVDIESGTYPLLFALLRLPL